MSKSKTPTPNKKPKKAAPLSSFKRPLILTLTSVVVLAATICLGLAGFALAYQGKILPNTKIGSYDFGDQTPEQAAVSLQKIVNELPKTVPTTIDGQNVTKPTITLADIGTKVDVNATVSRLYAFGREKSLSVSLKDVVLSIIGHEHMAAASSVDNGKLNQAADALAATIGTQASNAHLVMANDGTVSVAPEKDGHGVDAATISQQVIDSLGQLNPQIMATSKTLKPKITSAQATYALDQVNNYLSNAPLTLTAAGNKYSVSKAQVFDWLTFALATNPALSASPSPSLSATTSGMIQPATGPTTVLIASLDNQKITDYLNSLAKSINQDAQNAILSSNNGQITVSKTDTPGRKLDVDTSTKQIVAALSNSQTSAPQTVAMTVNIVNAQIQAGNLSGLGVNQLIGSGTTNFGNSSSNRIHNITVGMNTISGVLIPPDTEFSTIKTLGDINAAHGYLPELVIKNKTQVVPDYGGGLCQVSTTLFRSVLNAGLKVTDRTNHSFQVSYYQPPVGLDATIYDPAPDFKFFNDTGHYILIEGHISGHNLTFDLYGTSDGRTATIGNAVISNVVAPGAAVYANSSSVPKGTTRLIERATQGLTSDVSYTVTRNGQVINHQDFHSVYVPLPAQYLVGTG